MSEKESLESRRKDVNERRVRMELRQATARSISTAGCVFFILWLVVFPISAAAMFTWGGVYAAKVVPLNNAADAIMAAEGYVPYAPSAIINNTHLAMGYLNQSRAAVGSNNPCWLNPVVEESYTWNEHQLILIDGVIASNLSLAHGVFANSTFSTWNNVGNILNGVVIDIQGTPADGQFSMTQCITSGNSGFYVDFSVWLVGIAASGVLYRLFGTLSSQYGRAKQRLSDEIQGIDNRMSALRWEEVERGQRI